MDTKQLKFGFFIVLLSSGATFSSCHSSVKKEVPQSIQNKDTAKPVVLKEVRKNSGNFCIPIDTVINKDTLKVVWYRNGLIRCSLNRLSDTLTNLNVSWDMYDSLSQLAGGGYRILVPYDNIARQFLLNEKTVLVNLMDWKGRANLFLINRTKTTLKFDRKKNDYNPICQESGYVYVDLKNNYILNHDDQDRYQHGGENTSNEAPYWIHRYKIIDKHFVQTDLDTSFFKEFLKIDVDDISGARIFYNIIAHRENWERDKYIIHN